MATRLYFADREWTLADDAGVDVEKLKTRIDRAIHDAGTGMGSWIEVPVRETGQPTLLHLYVSQGVPILIAVDGS